MLPSVLIDVNSAWQLHTSLLHSVNSASAEGSFVKCVDHKTMPAVKQYYTVLIEEDYRPKETGFCDTKGARIA